MHREGRAVRIVYVDDDPNWALSLPEIGRLIGYNITAVQSSDEFMDILARGEPVNLFMTDIRMPEKSGYDLIDEYRERFPNNPVIVVTGYDTRKLKKIAHSKHINSIIMKPFPISMLHKELDSILK